MQTNVRSEYILLEEVPVRALASPLNTDKIKHVIVNVTDELLLYVHQICSVLLKQRSEAFGAYMLIKYY